MRLTRISAFFCACLLAAQSDPAALIQQALQAEESGNYAQAADRFRAALDMQPDDVATHVNLGIALAHLGRYDDALSEYQAAGKLLPGDPRIELNIALAYQKSGRLLQALDRFQSLHSADPRNDQVTMLLADCDLQLGHNAQVIELLQPLAAEAPSDLGVAYMLGTALIREQRIAEGQVLLDRILRNGDSAEAQFLLGTRMFESGDFPAAVKQLANAVALNPHLPQIQSFYGQALLNTGDPDAAAAAFRQELSTNAADFPSNLNLSQILCARRQFSDAIPYARRALLSQPNSPAAELTLAECFEGLGQASYARPYAEAAVAALPQSAEAHESLARIYSDLHLVSQSAGERQIAQKLAFVADPGPRLHDFAPVFELAQTASGKQVGPRDYIGRSPLVLVFGSYSCPNFRDAAPTLISLYRRYSPSASFLLVYIREAHAAGDWQSTRNTGENIALSPASNYAQKRNHAAMCSRKLHLPFPSVVDTMDGKVESAYHAWPSRVFVISQDGRVVYSSRLTELDFHPDDMEQALHRATVSNNRAAR